MSELPGGWAIANLPDVVFFQEGPGLRKYQYREAGVPFLNIRTFDDESINKSLCKFLDPEEVQSKYQHFLVDEGDILIATSGSIGKIAIPKLSDLPLLLNTSIMRFRPLREDVLIRGYIYFYLKSEHFLKQAEKAWTGTAQKNMGPSHIQTFNLLLPPLNEQRRIVAKLDSVFERTRRAREELEKIQKLCDRYKQAVLSAALRGDLTADWRKENQVYETAKDLLRHLQSQTNTGKIFFDTDCHTEIIYNSIPENWYWVKVEDIGEVFLGRQRSPKNHTGENMRLYVRAANITWNGWDLSDVKEMNFDERDFRKYQLKPGDVLINEGSGSADEVGKPAIWNGEISNCCFQNTLICVRPFESMSLFLYFVFLNAARSKTFVEETRGVNIFHIGKERLSQFKFALPPLIEQKEIVNTIEAIFKSIDRIEQESQKALKLCERLEQAALSKAFRGELVPQDPNDEPASVLLESIAAEKQQTATPSRKSRTKTPKIKQLALDGIE